MASAILLLLIIFPAAYNIIRFLKMMKNCIKIIARELFV
jgi:hypothetical protein